MSPLTVSTKLAWIATKSRSKECEWMGSNSHAPCGLVNCKVVGPSGPSLTDRMSELLTYGSVGGVGGNPGPYPAVDAGWRFCYILNITGAARVSAHVRQLRL